MSSNDYIQGSQIDSCLLLSEGCTVETRLLQLIGNIAVNFGEDPIKKKKKIQLINVELDLKIKNN